MKILILVLPMIIGFIIDTLLGDPYTLPHPVRLIGRFISWIENRLRKSPVKNEVLAGGMLAAIVTVVCTVAPLAVIIVCYSINRWLGAVAEGIMCYWLIAPKCLKDESMKVYNALEKNDTEEARRAVSMIVGRDTRSLDEKGITKAAVETVAENTSDGVTAPLMYIALGGAVLGFLYKAVNTMDSMIGYKNEKYISFGRCAARLDDVLNYFPSRLSALLMILSAYILKLDGRSAFKIWKRDRLNHSSPNSAQTESVCAGALNVRLGGDAYYFGKLYKKKTIGDDIKPIEPDDIKKANRLMYCTAVLTLITGIAARAALWGSLL